jgi:hypothetical protein
LVEFIETLRHDPQSVETALLTEVVAGGVAERGSFIA